MRDQQIGLGGGKRARWLCPFKLESNKLTLKEEFIKALTTTEGLLYLTLPELIGPVLAVASSWLREQSGGCEANLCSPRSLKWNSCRVTCWEQQGEGRRSFHEWSQWEWEERGSRLEVKHYYSVGVIKKVLVGVGATKHGCGLSHGSYKFSLIHGGRGETVLLFTLAQGAQQPTV